MQTGRRIQKFTCSGILLFLLAFHTQQPSVAMPEIEELASFIYRLAYNNELPGLTEEQWNKMSFLYKSYSVNKSTLESECKSLKNLFAKKILEPLPRMKELVDAQHAINQKETAIDEAAILVANQMKHLLTQEQIKAIFLFDFDKEFAGIRLTREQREQMEKIVLEGKKNEEGLMTKRALVELQLKSVLLNPSLEESEALAKQAELSNIQAAIDEAVLRTRIRLRTILTWAQKNDLYNTHRGNIFAALHLNSKQDAEIMDMHCKREAISIKGNNELTELGCKLMSIYKTPDSNDQELIDLQKKMDLISGQTCVGETELVQEMRTVLTPSQRDKLVEILLLQRMGKCPELPYPEHAHAHGHMHDHHLMPAAMEKGCKMGTEADEKIDKVNPSTDKSCPGGTSTKE